MHKLSIITTALLALGLAGPTAAATWSELDLNAPSNVDPSAAYSGSFNYNGQTYGPDSALEVPGQAGDDIIGTFDLSQLQAYTLYGKDGPNGHGHNDDLSLTSNDDSASPGAPVVYRMYRQNHSAAVVNLSRGTETRHFVKSVVGDKTAPGTLVNGRYNYAGVTFTNFPRGEFNYQVRVTGPSEATGSGTFTLNEIKIPGSQSSTGQDIFFDITSGKLNSTDLVANANNDGLVFNGDVTVTNADVSKPSAWAEIKGPLADPKYHLTLYGPNGAEIAGVIEGLPERIGTTAVIGARQ